MKSCQRFGMALMAIVAFAVFAHPALALPSLQLYLPDGQYVESGSIDGVDISESWYVSGSTIDLVVAGAKSPSWAKTIQNVRLWVSIETCVYQENPGGTVELTGPGGPILPVGPVQFGVPAPLSKHGIYPTYYFEFALPNFNVLAGETVYDYNNNFDPLNPGASGQGTGQLQDYTFSFSGYNWVHFDASGTVVGNGGKTKAVFAPYSHDAFAQVPEPATLALLGLGIVGLGLRRRK